MYIYKCMQSRSTGEMLVYLIRKKPMLSQDAAFMHYRILQKWEFNTLGD